jgi:hypothetical protein
MLLAVVAAGVVLVGGGQIPCGRPTPIDAAAPVGRAIPIAHRLWLGVYPFQQGHPTKVVAVAQRKFRIAVVLRGWNCATGKPLRFWYGEGNPGAPLSTNALRTSGDLRVTFGPWEARAMRGGYFMFWRTDLWKIVAYQAGRPVGTAIIRPGPD